MKYKRPCFVLGIPTLQNMTQLYQSPHHASLSSGGLPEPRSSRCEPIGLSFHHPFLSPPSSQIEINPLRLVAVADLSPKPSSESNPDSDEEFSRWGTKTVLINSAADIAKAYRFERLATIESVSVTNFLEIDLCLTDFHQSCPALTSLDLQNTTFKTEINFTRQLNPFRDG